MFSNQTNLRLKLSLVLLFSQKDFSSNCPALEIAYDQTIFYAWSIMRLKLSVISLYCAKNRVHQNQAFVGYN